MGWLSLSPRVLVDDESLLIVEERHIGRSALLAIWLVLTGVFLAPALRSRSITMLLVGVVLGGIVVGLPFLAVLALSKFHRLEVRPGSELVSRTVYRLRPERSVRVNWGEIAKVICERRSEASDTPDGLCLTLYLLDGSQRRLLSGWYSEDLAATLRRYLADKFTVAA